MELRIMFTKGRIEPLDSKLAILIVPNFHDDVDIHNLLHQIGKPKAMEYWGLVEPPGEGFDVEDLYEDDTGGGS